MGPTHLSTCLGTRVRETWALSPGSLSQDTPLLALHGHLFMKSWGVWGPTHTPPSEYPQDELIYSTRMTSKFIFPAPSPLSADLHSHTAYPTPQTQHVQNQTPDLPPLPHPLLLYSAHGTNTHQGNDPTSS